MNEVDVDIDEREMTEYIYEAGDEALMLARNVDVEETDIVSLEFDQDVEDFEDLEALVESHVGAEGFRMTEFKHITDADEEDKLLVTGEVADEDDFKYIVYYTED